MTKLDLISEIFRRTLSLLEKPDFVIPEVVIGNPFLDKSRQNGSPLKTCGDDKLVAGDKGYSGN